MNGSSSLLSGKPTSKLHWGWRKYPRPIPEVHGGLQQQWCLGDSRKVRHLQSKKWESLKISTITKWQVGRINKILTQLHRMRPGKSRMRDRNHTINRKIISLVIMIRLQLVIMTNSLSKEKRCIFRRPQCLTTISSNLNTWIEMRVHTIKWVASRPKP
jgi:hypothetical protein